MNFPLSDDVKKQTQHIYLHLLHIYNNIFFSAFEQLRKSDDTLNLVRAHTPHIHRHAHTVFSLSSACLIPITEVCREGPRDWLTGYPEDKQVYVLARTVCIKVG